MVHTAMTNIIGIHDIGKCKNNGLLLLRRCAEHQQAIANTIFRLSKKDKVTRMYHRSKHWKVRWDFSLVQALQGFLQGRDGVDPCTLPLDSNLIAFVVSAGESFSAIHIWTISWERLICTYSSILDTRFSRSPKSVNHLSIRYDLSARNAICRCLVWVRSYLTGVYICI